MPRTGLAVQAPVSPLRAWLALSRIPFFTVSVIPFILGMSVAVRHGHPIEWGVAAAATGVVCGFHLAAHWFGEYFDLEGDALNTTYNRFSGGTRVLVKGLIEPRKVLVGAVVVSVVSIALGILVLLSPVVGSLALPLGFLGGLAAVGYSTTPFQWAYRGLGEIVIGLTFGWLTVNTGYYILAGAFSVEAMLVSIPVGLSVFNVIVINEFPDIDADRAVGKNTLVVRRGPETMVWVYVGAGLVAALIMAASVHVLSAGPWLCLFLLPAILLGTLNALGVARGGWRDPVTLEMLAGRSILLNLLITAGFGLGLGVL